MACQARTARGQDDSRRDARGRRPHALIDLLYGAIYYRLLLHTRPHELEQIDAALGIAFKGLL